MAADNLNGRLHLTGVHQKTPTSFRRWFDPIPHPPLELLKRVIRVPASRKLRKRGLTGRPDPLPLYPTEISVTQNLFSLNGIPIFLSVSLYQINLLVPLE